jgi:hypothetical protein
MSDPGNLEESIDNVLNILQPLKADEFSEKLNKVSVYIGTIGKSFNSYNSALESIRQQSGGDQDKYRKEAASKAALLKASLASSTKFARMNLDMAMVQALDKLVRRPNSANKVDEQKKKRSLQDWFDQLPDPSTAMLEHFNASSNPLDKYLVAGQWGHEYLRKRRIDPEAFDSQICELISCSDLGAVGMVMNYGKLIKAIDAVEERAVEMIGAMEIHASYKIGR